MSNPKRTEKILTVLVLLSQGFSGTQIAYPVISYSILPNIQSSSPPKMSRNHLPSGKALDELCQSYGFSSSQTKGFLTEGTLQTIPMILRYLQILYVDLKKGRPGWLILGASSPTLSRTAPLLSFCCCLLLFLILRSYLRFHLEKKKNNKVLLP